MKTNNFSVRLAVESDFPAIINIVEEISELAPEKKAQFNWDRFQISDELQKATALVTATSEGLTAFLCYRETADFLEITVLATAPGYRNRGVQSLLVQKAIADAAAKNKNLFLEVHEENLSAIAFYRKRGFTELPSRKHYYSDGKSALVFIYRVEVT